MFIQNKYLLCYNNLIEKAKSQQRIKQKGDRHQYHHIIPRSLGGNNDKDNLVLLSYREHKVAHRLLIKFTQGSDKYKMMRAYTFFDKGFYVVPPQWTKEKHDKGVETRKRKGSYKKGKENVFASEKVKEIVRSRMTLNNPMFREDVKEKYLKNRPHSIPVITPKGYFYSVKAAARSYNTTAHKMKKMISDCTDGTFIFATSDDRHETGIHT
jgi:hypothetical protein